MYKNKFREKKIVHLSDHVRSSWEVEVLHPRADTAPGFAYCPGPRPPRLDTPPGPARRTYHRRNLNACYVVITSPTIKSQAFIKRFYLYLCLDKRFSYKIEVIRIL